MHSPPGSTLLLDCTCKAGFYLLEGSTFGCVACPEGTSSPDGSLHLSSCKCPAGYFSATDAVDSFTCNQCPGMSSSAEGSTRIGQCICPPGLGIAANSFDRHITSPHDVCNVDVRSPNPPFQVAPLDIRVHTERDLHISCAISMHI